MHHRGIITRGHYGTESCSSDPLHLGCTTIDDLTQIDILVPMHVSMKVSVDLQVLAA